MNVVNKYCVSHKHLQIGKPDDKKLSKVCVSMLANGTKLPSGKEYGLSDGEERVSQL